MTSSHILKTGVFFEEENFINKTIPIFEDKILAIGL